MLTWRPCQDPWALQDPHILLPANSAAPKGANCFGKKRRHQLADVDKTTSSTELQPLHYSVNTLVQKNWNEELE